MLKYAEKTFANILQSWRCSLLEFGGGEDHVDLLVDIHPALNISTLVNNLKSASSRGCAVNFPIILRRFAGNRCSGIERIMLGASVMLLLKQ